MKREIPSENRRVVTKRKKTVILVGIFIGIALLIWFKMPYQRTYTAELMLHDAGEAALYGTLVDVTVDVRVQRYFLRSPTHEGTVTVEGDTFSTPGGTLVPTFSLLGALENTASFTLVCSEWQGNYLLTRCVADVENGMITSVYLRDEAGVYAGQYGRMPKNSQ